MASAFSFFGHMVASIMLGIVALMASSLPFSSVYAQVDDSEDEEEFELLFFASPRVAQKGDTVLLEWEAVGADYCTGSDSWSGQKQSVGNQLRQVRKLKKYTYTLECYNRDGDLLGEASRIVEVVKIKSAKQLPLPSVDFRTNKTTVAPGGTVTLSWKSKKAVGCRASGPDGWGGLKPTTGKEILSPDSAGTYSLSCWNADRKYTGENVVSVAMKEAEGNMNQGLQMPLQQPTLWGGGFGGPPPSCPPGFHCGPPPISSQPLPAPTMISPKPSPMPINMSFQSSRSTFYTAGDPVLLTWWAHYATKCIASGGWSGDRPVEGSEHVRPTETTEYKLTCYSSESSLDRSSSVEIRKVEKKVTGSVQLDFNPARSIIHPGKEVTLTWNARNARSCSASGAWSGDKPLAGSITVNVDKSETYYLDCKNDTQARRKSAVIDLFKEPSTAPKPVTVTLEPKPVPVKSVLSIQSPPPTLTTFGKGAKDVILGTFIVTNTSDSEVSFVEPRFTDADGTDGLGKSFTNMRLRKDSETGSPVGISLSLLFKNSGEQQGFGVNATSIPAGKSVTFIVLADVLPTADLSGYDKDDALRLVGAREYNAQTKSEIDVEKLPMNLQRFALLQDTGKLSIKLSSLSPSGKSFEQGSEKNVVAQFDLEAGKDRDLLIKRIEVSIGSESDPTNALKKVAVYEGDALLGNTESTAHQIGLITLSTPLNIQKSEKRTITFTADISSSAKVGMGLTLSFSSIAFDTLHTVEITPFPIAASPFTVKEKPTQTQTTSTSTPVI